MNKSITIEHPRDYGCEISDADRHAYHVTVEQAVEAAYPGASACSADADVYRTRALAAGFGSENSSVAETCVAIAQEVWDRAEFYVRDSQ